MVPVLKYLLDTHAWIWAVLGHARLGARARTALGALATGERVGLAAISLKEAAWLLSKGRVTPTDASEPWADWLRRAVAAPSLDVLPLSVEVAIESERLPAAFPADPADRLIAATARVHDLVLLTADAKLRASDQVRTLW